MSKVLLVEDEVHARLSMSIVLRKAGFEVQEASNGQEALEYFELNRNGSLLDLMVLDLQLPGISGLDVIDSLRERQIQVSILIVSGNWNRKTREEVFRRSCFHYLEKPFSPDELTKKVTEVLKKDKAQEQEDEPVQGKGR